MLFVMIGDLELPLTKFKALIAVRLTCLANRGGNMECVRFGSNVFIDAFHANICLVAMSCDYLAVSQ